MDTSSVWRASAPRNGFAMLQSDLSTDVLVIGGGITGVTLALLLARQGRSVVLLEAETIGSGSTGDSTGNLYETVSEGLSALAARWGADVARQVLEQRRAAISFIETQCAGADTGFRRCPQFLYARDDGLRDQIAREHDALVQAGASVRLERSVPAPLPAAVGEVLVLDGQAQFHPQAYVSHLSKLAAQAGAQLYEHSRVIELDARARRARTAAGSVRAHHLVLATHTPKGSISCRPGCRCTGNTGSRATCPAPSRGRGSSGAAAVTACRCARPRPPAGASWSASARRTRWACTTRKAV